MRLEVRTYLYHDDLKYYFDIVDMDDTVMSTVTADLELPELIHDDGKGYAREETAERNGQKWIDNNEANLLRDNDNVSKPKKRQRRRVKRTVS
jgi:hypothetical protein